MKQSNKVTFDYKLAIVEFNAKAESLPLSPRTRRMIHLALKAKLNDPSRLMGRVAGWIIGFCLVSVVVSFVAAGAWYLISKTWGIN